MPAFNITKDKNAWVSLPVTVPSGTVVGQVVPIGSAGLTGLALTNIAVGPNADLIDYDAPGLAIGQATCTLIGCSLVAELAITTAITQYNPVYLIQTSGLYTAAANNGSGTNYQFIGYFIDPTLSAAGTGRVALLPS